jgi:hypothetical protein
VFENVRCVFVQGFVVFDDSVDVTAECNYIHMTLCRLVTYSIVCVVCYVGSYQATYIKPALCGVYNWIVLASLCYCC